MGEYFTHERGTDIVATFSEKGLVVKENTDYDQNSACVEYKRLNGTTIKNRFNAQILLFDEYVDKPISIIFH